MKNIDIMAKMTRDIDIKKAQTGDLVKWYNENSGSRAIAKFKDRATAEKRCAELKQAINELNNPGGTKGNGKKTKAEPKEKAAKTPKAKKEPAGDRGRKFAGSDKRIYRKSKENPRREGTHGWTSWNVIKDGMTYEEFIAAGGRNVDLRHDIIQGRIELK